MANEFAATCNFRLLTKPAFAAETQTAKAVFAVVDAVLTAMLTIYPRAEMHPTPQGFSVVGHRRKLCGNFGIRDMPRWGQVEIV